MEPNAGSPLAVALARWRALPSGARALLIGMAVLAVVVGVGMKLADTVFADYQVLFSNLSPEDAGAVVEALRTGQVPYRVGDAGQILVPAARVHEWRMRLASQGVPSGGVIGFEIFDKNQWGLTDFSQRLNFQRALQGELARTIGQLREVQQARVHLALPAPRVFASQDKPPSASVVLRLRPGASLRPEQVRGIVHLVTAAVEGLSPERVTVVDAGGRVLASGQERGNGVSGNQGEARTAVEQDVERRIQSLLDPIVGAGRSAVRVAALVNFDQVERTEERFDPKPLVRAQTKSTETSEAASSQPQQAVADRTPAPAPPTPGGRAPAPAPVEKAPPAPLVATSTNKTQRENEQTTYDIARTVERTVVAPGEVRRLSVAVLLDIPLVNGTRTPRADEELDRIRRLVTSAAGIRADRKDELEVVQVPFDPAVGIPADATGGAPAEARAGLPRWAWIAGGVAAAVVVGGAVAVTLRGRRRRRTALEEALQAATGAAARGPGGVALPGALVSALDLTPKLTEQDELRERVLAAAREHPDEIAQIIRAWMFRRRTAP
jgi:flagellar M-ring protein FliF